MTNETENAMHGLAIDVGGTFTDVVLVDDHTGQLTFTKVLSTPADPALGSIAGATEALENAGIVPAQVGRIVHATTVATNALLERKGAITGLITTAGFTDTLAIGREYRYDIYDLNLTQPAPLVDAARRLGVSERITAEGQVLVVLDDADVRAALAHLVEQEGVEAIAICLLNSFEWPAHEQRISKLAAALYPSIAISASSAVAAEIREYERTSTTVVDAYVKPMVQHYVARLADGLKDLQLQPPLAMMLSHGGIGPAQAVTQAFPVRIIESGPAAGAIAAAAFARSVGRNNAIAFDMGGTTAKLSVIRDGEPAITNDFEVAHVHRFRRGSGLPLQISAIELLEIGAGGGSIAHIDALGLLKVGPESAGASPGPACYGQGGTAPTITDADLVLGYLDADSFLGGDMTLDPSKARSAIVQTLGPSLAPDSNSSEPLAWGIHDLVNENMAAATRAHAAENGIDLRGFTLIAFGGAGPIHAYALAKKLGIREVICPFGAGVASAIGCLLAPPAVDAVRAMSGRLQELDWAHVRAVEAEIFAQSQEVLDDLLRADTHQLGRIDDRDIRMSGLARQLSFDMQCEGQGYSITVPVPSDHRLDESLFEAITTAFSERYEAIYGHLPPPVPLEVVAFRSRVFAPGKALKVNEASDEQTDVSVANTTRPLYFPAAGGFVDGAVYDRYTLTPGHAASGPAVIEERETTVLVGPDATFRIDGSNNLIITIDE